MRRVRQMIYRRPPRHTVRLPCQVVRERDFRLVADKMTDLSVTGMLVTPADPVLTGERLIVSFKLPGSDVYVDAEAIVARVVHGRRPGEVSRALGVEFSSLPGKSADDLNRALRRSPLIPPGARPGRRSAVSVLAALLSA
ncbi:MAG TPA: PilZ domain-containing protein [Polyangiaceae bacterium]